MGNVQRLPSLGQTNIYLRESKETLSRCFIMEYGASAHSTLPPPSSRVQVHRQRGLFVVVFWEEIHRKQDFMVAKSALNFLSLFLSLFLSKELLILDFLFIVHLYVLVGKLNYLICKMVSSAEGRCTCIYVYENIYKSSIYLSVFCLYPCNSVPICMIRVLTSVKKKKN